MKIKNKIELYNAIQQKKVYEARRDDNAFREFILKDDITGEKITQQEIHKTWIEHIKRCKKQKKHCAIIAPWGHGKTVNVVIGETLNEIGKNNKIRIKIINSGDEYATDRVKIIKQYIDSDIDFQSVYPKVIKTDKLQWTDHRIYIQRDNKAIDPTVEARGINSKGIGGRADILIFDDPVDEKSIGSQKIRETVRMKYQNLWVPRLIATGFIIYIATRWAEDDLTKTVIESGRYSVLIQKVSENFKSIEQYLDNKKIENIKLCSFWNEESLKNRCKEIGIRAFDRGFRQKSINEEELMFPHFQECIRYDDIPKWQYTFTGVDLSGKNRKGNIICTIGVNNNTKFLIDVRSGNWSSPETAEQIKMVNDKYHPLIIHVENNAYQQALLDWLDTKNFKNLPVKAFTTGSQKSNFEIGLPSLDVQFERKEWVFFLPRHQAGCDCDFCKFKNEMIFYPGYDSTDRVMAFWFAVEAYRKYGNRTSIFDIDEKNHKMITAGLRKKEF